MDPSSITPKPASVLAVATFNEVKTNPFCVTNLAVEVATSVFAFPNVVLPLTVKLLLTTKLSSTVTSPPEFEIAPC